MFDSKKRKEGAVGSLKPVLVVLVFVVVVGAIGRSRSAGGRHFRSGRSEELSVLLDSSKDRQKKKRNKNFTLTPLSPMW